MGLSMKTEGDVLCGGKWKSTCADCPEGHGEAWCNGVCVWTTQGGGNCVAKACCTSNTAECNACTAGVSVAVYCANNAHASGCSGGCILQGMSCAAAPCVGCQQLLCCPGSQCMPAYN